MFNFVLFYCRARKPILISRLVTRKYGKAGRIWNFEMHGSVNHVLTNGFLLYFLQWWRDETFIPRGGRGASPLTWRWWRCLHHPIGGVPNKNLEGSIPPGSKYPCDLKGKEWFFNQECKRNGNYMLSVLS